MDEKEMIGSEWIQNKYVINNVLSKIFISSQIGLTILWIISVIIIITMINLVVCMISPGHWMNYGNSTFYSDFGKITINSIVWSTHNGNFHEAIMVSAGLVFSCDGAVVSVLPRCQGAIFHLCVHRKREWQKALSIDIWYACVYCVSVQDLVLVSFVYIYFWTVWERACSCA